MDNLRLLLFFALAVVLLLIYQAWMKDYGRPITAPETVQQPSVIENAAISNGIPDVSEAPQTPTPSMQVPPVIAESTASQDLIQIETDVLKLQISRRGGTVVSAWLKDYAVRADDPGTKFRLLKPNAPNMFIAQSGLLGGNKGLLPTHEAIFSSVQDSFVLEPEQNELVVELLWTHPSGVEVKKHYRFQRGSYVIDLSQVVTNKTGSPLPAVRSYEQLQRTDLVDPNATRFVHTYTGGVYYSPEDKYAKVSFDKMRDDKLQRVVSGGWIGMIQHYFMSAWIPPAEVVETFYTNVLDNARYIIGQYSEPATLPNGASKTFENRLFVGPKLQDTLSSIAPGLDLAVDYGWLTILAQPIHWLLSKIHAVVGNWGWSIILLTILIKAAFYKLSETSYKSMANMRKMTPRMQALKDRYGDDKQRLNQAMMELYKKEKINPLGGCLPIVVQIPVFIALYWVLLESVELRHAPFALWINNLSDPDPYFVLPLIMGVSMFIQQKLNPAPPDPIQAKVMMSLPFVFTVFFAFFPSGLVLYWVVNNILSISQQWYITQNIEKAAAKART
ncbi:MAG: membrane protein insertase YidC [Chromatiaceae bacterium]|nr:membrane protein insertase YidC [Chromatiaceae bacterium]